MISRQELQDGFVNYKIKKIKRIVEKDFFEEKEKEIERFIINSSINLNSKIKFKIEVPELECHSFTMDNLRYVYKKYLIDFFENLGYAVECYPAGHKDLDLYIEWSV